jgi:two-component system sensor kinase
VRLGLASKLIAPWLAFILAGGVGMYWYMHRVSVLEHDISKHNQLHAQAVEISKELMLRTQERWGVLLDHLAHRDPTSRPRIMDSEKKITALSEELGMLFSGRDEMSVHARLEQNRSVLAGFMVARSGLTDAYLDLIAAIDAHDLQKQVIATDRVASKMKLVQAALGDLMQYHITARNSALDYARQEQGRMQALLYQAISLGLILALGFTIYQALDIVRPLQNLTDTITQYDMGGERLELGTTPSRKDEIGLLAQNFEHMAERITLYLHELAESQSVLLESMGSISKVGGWELDLRNMHLSWTKETYRIHEVDPSVKPDLAGAINFYAPEAQPVIQAAVEQAMKEGTPWDLELPFITAKGNKIWVRAQGKAILENGKAVRLNGAFQDITEQRNLIDSIKQANADLEGFSYSVSHDLRTPLRAIDGFSRILIEDYSSVLDEEGRRLLNVVRDNTQRMSQLIDDILHFSRAGRTALNLTECDMDALVHQVAEELAPSRAGRDIHLEISKLPTVIGDRAMLHQVIENLLSNAIKFTRDRAEAHISIGYSNGARMHTFYVKDDGVGFDMRYVDKLFGVFQRLHGITEFEGTGIGLAIAKRVITRHGGSIWAKAELDKGATFFFTLPEKEIHDEQRK